MPVSHWRHGAIMAGYIRMTRVAGFSGIVAITSAGAWALKTGVRSAVGRQCADTFHRSGRTASQAIRYAAHGSAKRCFTGPTTAEISKTQTHKIAAIFGRQRA